MAQKKRLDILLHELFPIYSRQQIQSWIMQGKVSVEGKVITKPGTPITGDARINLDTAEPRYVSRAGLKLEKALQHFDINVRGLVVLDAGISTGGFTDCLLQHGARTVYGIDVGYGQVHEKIRANPRVIIMERTNLRNLDLNTLKEAVEMVTLDLSFISILKVMPIVQVLLKPGGILVALIKPQFEAGRSDVGRGGIVKDTAVHERVIKQVTEGICEHGFIYQGLVESPILGSTGNKEFLAYFVRIP